MTREEKTYTIMDTVKKYLRLGLNVIIMITILCFGFAGGMSYKDTQDKILVEHNPFNHIYTAPKTTISVTDKGELMIIDRESGKMVVYENQIGLTIFKSYATKIYNENTQEINNNKK